MSNILKDFKLKAKDERKERDYKTSQMKKVQKYDHKCTSKFANFSDSPECRNFAYYPKTTNKKIFYSMALNFFLLK